MAVIISLAIGCVVGALLDHVGSLIMEEALKIDTVPLWIRVALGVTFTVCSAFLTYRSIKDLFGKTKP